MTRTIKLTRGHVAVVDDEDFEMFGHLRWHARPSRKTVYATRREWDGEKWANRHLHRDILDAPAGLLVDHRDGDGLNCRRSNLRVASAQQNAANIINSKPGAVPLRGVTPVKAAGGRTRYRAQIALRGRKYSLGVYDTPEAAALAYDVASMSANSGFAVLNNPEKAAQVLKVIGAGVVEGGNGR